MKVLLLSHGSLAEEMKKTAHMILGDFDNVETCCLNEGDSIETFEKCIISKLTDSDTPSLIVTDLLGGSPFITMAKIYKELSSELRKSLKIVTGMSLSMVIEIINNKDSLPLDNIATLACQANVNGTIDATLKFEGEINNEYCTS